MKNPIGIFDSGYGGLTILEKIQEALPEYDYLYLGDNARAPYGSRSFDVVYEFTLQAVEELFNQGCHLVILACNTASAKALRNIQQKDLPTLAPNKRVLGVIRPSTETVGELSKSKVVGILATEGTVLSNSYAIELQKFAPKCEVVQHACPLWVPLIENDQYQSEEGKGFIRKDVEALLEKNPRIDTIVLGCTHYPVLKEYIESILPEGIQVIAQGNIVAEKLVDYLQRHPEIAEKCSKNGQTHFITTETSLLFDETATRILGRPVQSKTIHLG